MTAAPRPRPASRRGRAAAVAPPPPFPVAVVPGAVWSDHCCRHCGNRLLAAGPAAWVCGTCERVAEGPDPAALCNCGALPRPAGARGPRFRCVRSPNPRPSFPAVIVVEFAEGAPA